MSTIDERLDRVCVEFEDALRNDKREPLDGWLDRVAPDLRQRLFEHLLALKLDYCEEEHGNQTSWIEKYQEFESSVRSTFDGLIRVVFSPPGVGTKIGRFEIREIAGQGSFGCVYKAWDAELERWVALKAPRLSPSATRSTADAFCREVKSLARLRHPNVLVIYDVVRDDHEWPYMVLDYVEKTLDDAPNSRASEQDLKNTIGLIIDAAQGLDYAHRKGIVHRDLKPANILIDNEGRGIVGDFGLAVFCETQQDRESESAGTLVYMSPEQVRGETHWMDGRADIWALGVILYRSLCGQLPFDGLRDEIAEAIIAKPAKPPRQIDSAISSELERICLKCLSKNPKDRYTTAGDLAVDLTNASKAKIREYGSSRQLLIGAVFIAVAVVVAIISKNWLTFKDGVSVVKQVNDSAQLDTSTNHQPVEPVFNDVPSSDGKSGSLVSSFDETIGPWFAFGPNAAVSMDDDAHGGRHAARVESRRESWEGLALDLLTRTRQNRIYWIRAFAKSLETSFPLQFQIQKSDSSGQSFPCVTAQHIDSDWTLIEGALTTGDSDIHEMLVIARSNMPSSLESFLIDDASLTEMKIGESLIENPQLDSLQPWRQTGETSTLRLITFEDGRNEVLVSDRDGGGAGIGQSVTFKKGSFYFFRAVVKAVKDELPLRIQLRLTDGEKKLYPRITGRDVDGQHWVTIEGGYRAPCSCSGDIWVNGDGHSGPRPDFSIRSFEAVEIHPVESINF